MLRKTGADNGWALGGRACGLGGRSTSSGGSVRNARVAGVTRAGPGRAACAARMAARTVVWRASSPAVLAASSLPSAARAAASGSTSRRRVWLWASRPHSDRSAARAPSSTSGVSERSSTTAATGGMAAPIRATTASSNAPVVPAHSWPLSRRHMTCPGARLAWRRSRAATRDHAAVLRRSGKRTGRDSAQVCMASRFRTWADKKRTYGLIAE
jgi:hypothetical protein